MSTDVSLLDEQPVSALKIGEEVLAVLPEWLR
jgi:hypothetical protein